MSIKSILCVFDGTPDELSSLNMAFAIAKVYAAHLRILHITPEITPYLVGLIASASIDDAIEIENGERLKNARDFTSYYASLNHVTLDTHDAPAHHASATFVHRTGAEDVVLAEEGRLSDLVIVGHTMNDLAILYDDALLTALFDTGRPALVTPHLHGPMPREWEPKNIVLLWNGSMEAARAVYNAAPVLEKAEKVYVLVAHSHNEYRHVTKDEGIMEYLKAHGIRAEVILIDHTNHAAGEALLAKAHELKADLIVMGAYGHTRAREMILGGVTHNMLRKADIPLLLSH